MFLKNIDDISIINGFVSITRSGFPNSSTLREQIQSLPYSGSNLTKDPNVENAKLPAFAQVFYYLFFQNKSIPDENLFIAEYLKWLNIKSTDEYYNLLGTNLKVISIKARILRSYPSLIRDLHFYFMLYEKKTFQFVEYSLRKDYQLGQDIIIRYNEVEYAISIYINTSRGSYYKDIKYSRHDYSNVRELVLNVEFNELEKVGNFYLLNNVHVDKIIDNLRTS